MINNLKIGQRLALGFSLLLLMLVISVGVALSRMGAMSDNLTRIVRIYNVEQDHAVVMELRVQAVQRYIRTLLLSEDSKDHNRAMEQIEQARKEYDEASNALQKMLQSEEAKGLFAHIQEVRDKSRGFNDQVIQLQSSNRRKEAVALLFGPARESTNAWVKAQEDLSHFLDKQMEKKYEEAEGAYHEARSLMITLAVLALGLGLAAAILITRSIANPIREFVGVLGTAATGDLRVVARVDSRDELGELGASLNAMIGQLRNSLQEIQEVTTNVAQASSEISSGNSDLSARTEQQAANLEETASAMEQFTSNLNQTTENALQAHRTSSQAQQVANDGGTAVKQLVASMDEINAASARIAEIIGVVDEIAFQTNLLALNAAVEAARAGEQGRGFAVVASEVRNLAKRSAEAAKEIKGLIKDSVSKAQEGQKVAVLAGDSMGSIVQQVGKTSGLIADIATATREQNTGVGEINKAIMQMDEVTQQNAALVEQAAASAEALDQQAQNLAAIVARFQTGAEGKSSFQAPARRPTPRPAPRTQVQSHAAKSGAPALSKRAQTLPAPSAQPPSDGDAWEAF